ncbi:MAG: endolytic transglycosylase MltG [Rhodobacteraceae bacterium]|nr:endolytic transglycosylase MltG [Paracoccaceae bacterium]
MATPPDIDDKAATDDQAGDQTGDQFLGKRHAFMIATMVMISLLTVLMAFGMISYSFLKYRYIGDGPLEREAVFEIHKGTGLSQIAAKLSREGVIHSKNTFKIFAKIDGGETSLKAGEYAIPAQASMRDVYEILQAGQAILYPVTIAEGLTSAQIVRLIAGNDKIAGSTPIVPPEGVLLPETYMLPKSMTKVQLIAKMQTAQTELLDALWADRADNLPIKTKRDALILASIVEKETGQSSERERVAGVFINRLNKGMRLESDPTIIYGLTGGEKLGRGLRRSEIDRKTDWNTYQISGLPKTPICNPGRAAIAAVLNPAQTNEIFFVADGTGGHVFSTTLRDHINNVNKWRKVERQRKKAAKKAKKNADKKQIKEELR